GLGFSHRVLSVAPALRSVPLPEMLHVRSEVVKFIPLQLGFGCPLNPFLGRILGLFLLRLTLLSVRTAALAVLFSQILNIFGEILTLIPPLSASLRPPLTVSIHSAPTSTCTASPPAGTLPCPAR